VQPDEATGKVDLTAARVEGADQKTLLQLADELEGVIRAVRERKDKALEKGKGTVGLVPFIFMNLFLKLISFLMYTLNLDLSALGMPKDPFGAVTIQGYDAISEKNNKTEFVYEEPVTVTCVRSLFPHLGYQTCWYLSRHAEQRINY